MRTELGFRTASAMETDNNLLSIELKANHKYEIGLEVQYNFWTKILGKPSPEELEEEIRNIFFEKTAGSKFYLMSVDVEPGSDKAKIVVLDKSSGPQYEVRKYVKKAGVKNVGVGVFVVTVGGLIAATLGLIGLKQLKFIVTDVKEIAVMAPGTVMWIALPAVMLGGWLWTKQRG